MIKSCFYYRSEIIYNYTLQNVGLEYCNIPTCKAHMSVFPETHHGQHHEASKDLINLETNNFTPAGRHRYNRKYQSTACMAAKPIALGRICQIPQLCSQNCLTNSF